MDETSTLNLLIRYHYLETSLTDTVIARRMIDFDREAAQWYYEIIHVEKLLNRALCRPTDKSRKAILDYSRKLPTLS